MTLIDHLHKRVTQARARTLTGGVLSVKRRDEVGAYWEGMADAFEETIALLEVLLAMPTEPAKS